MSGKEFPNNWEEVHSAKDDDFETCSFEEFMTGMSIWQLPSSHQFLMRVYNSKTNKVKEYAYKQESAARKRLQKECADTNNEIVLCDNYSIHLIKQTNESDYA
jgi:hypothetical protein